MDSINFINSRLANPVEKVSERPAQEIAKKDNQKQELPAFDKILSSELKSHVNPELKFSAHAKTRLSSRGIELSASDIVKMQEAIARANQKGSRESLILTDKAAFVVSVKNSTVITAVDRESLKDNVFTNIDSTVMI